MQAVISGRSGQDSRPTTDYRFIDFLISTPCELGAHESILNKSRMYNKHMTRYWTRWAQRTQHGSCVGVAIKYSAQLLGFKGLVV